MRFRTDVTLPVGQLEISHNDEMLLLGSCFAQNIGSRLQNCKFNVDVNPLGIIYNPLSVTEALRHIVRGERFTSSSPEIFQYNGAWHSIMHHGSFSHIDRDTALSNINARLLAAHDRLAGLSVLMITFGTAYVYRRAEDGRVVSNCHKLPQRMFSRSLITVSQAVDALAPVIEELVKQRPVLKVLFTVSPIRHLRDGAHNNQLSKATLLLAIEELCRLFPANTLYFPSYEIMLDELRDYRFYAEDMTHPSSVAIDYLWECFATSYFSPSTQKLNKELENIARALAHRPFNEDSDEYRLFLSKILLKIEEIKRIFPYFDFEKEIHLCNTL